MSKRSKAVQHELTNEERLTRLRQHIGPYAVKRLREGKALLHCWRGSSPHNWYVESCNGRGSHLWHSSDWGDVPDRSMFQLEQESQNKIACSLIHRDGGKPFRSTYVLRSEYMLAAQ